MSNAPAGDFDLGDDDLAEGTPGVAYTDPEDLGQPVAPSNPLDELAAELAAEVKPEYETLTVPLRPKFAVRFLPAIDGPTLRQWQEQSRIVGNRAQRRARTAGEAPELDNTKFAGIVVVNTAEALLRGPEGAREELTDDRGRPLNLRSAEFLRMTGKPSAIEATRHFYGSDGHLDAAARAVLAAAGWGDELAQASDVDPTRGESPA